MYLDKLCRDICRGMKWLQVMVVPGVYTLDSIREMSGDQKNGICESVDLLHEPNDWHQVSHDAIGGEF